jgi:hypothetical protein
MGNTFTDEDDGRVYGKRWLETADEPLTVVAGRILDDLQRSRDAGQLPGTTTIAITVDHKGKELAVVVTRQVDDESRQFGWNKIRAVIDRSAKQYNWRHRENPEDVRFNVTCRVQKATDDLDIAPSATLIG